MIAFVDCGLPCLSFLGFTFICRVVNTIELFFHVQYVLGWHPDLVCIHYSDGEQPSIKNPKSFKSDKIVVNKQQTEEYQSKFISRHLNVTLQELYSTFLNNFKSFINLFESNNKMTEEDFRFNGLDVSKILNATITSTTSNLLNNSNIWWIVSKKKCNENNRSYTDVRDLFLAAGIKAGNDIKNQFVFEPPGEFVKLSPDQRAERKMILFKASWKYFSKLDMTPLAENLTQLFTDLQNNSKTNCQNLDELADLLKNRYLIPSSRFILDEYNLRKPKVPITENNKVDVATDVPASVSAKVDVAADVPASVITKVDVAADVPASVTTKAEMAADVPVSVTTKAEMAADVPVSVTTKVEMAADVPVSVTTKVDVATDVPAFVATKVDVSTDVPIFVTTQTDVSTDVPLSATTVVDMATDVPLSATTKEKVDMAADVPLSGSAQVDTSTEIPATENTQRNMPNETTDYGISQVIAKVLSRLFCRHGECKVSMLPKTAVPNNIQIESVSSELPGGDKVSTETHEMENAQFAQNKDMETSIRTTISEDFEFTMLPLSVNTKGDGFAETPVMRSQVNVVSIETPATENSNVDDMSAGTTL
ncbi:uncharacterized protein LOC106667225 isoform X5 [Cimex lectularius]|uniref:Uncharacterized protein n=1 Tax=Cimex lectularius TaxID=79782 RepID=A0A8I6SPG2_CIMLE|nr:uncharacterized protein LOC106667225 isoform X5 [Cimex lectularius]